MPPNNTFLISILITTITLVTHKYIQLNRVAYCQRYTVMSLQLSSRTLLQMATINNKAHAQNYPEAGCLPSIILILPT